MNRQLVLAVGVLCVMSACARSAPTETAIRLVDRFDDKAVSNRSAKAAATIPRTEWRFDGDAPEPAPKEFAATRGWEAGVDISGLAIRDGLLTGRTTSPFSTLRVERTKGLDDHDQLYAVELRMRVSAGANVAVETLRREKIDWKEVEEYSRAFAWEITSPLQPGDEIRTYTLKKPRPLPASDIRHLLIRPSDVTGADFAIESVRLIFRKEHLASIASGVGFQGMTEVYKESIVSRSPETISIPVTLPTRPWLDLAVGTIDDGPVTFRVMVRRDGSRREERMILERTVTTPYRWEHSPLDLSRFAGQKVTLVMSVNSDAAGTVGIWGAPVVRQRLAGNASSTGRDAPAASGSTRAANDGRRHPQGVILIWADTLRRDHLEAYGYGRATAPNISRMAREGVIFRGNVSQATWTKVSTPSLMTSLYPSSHGVRDFFEHLPASATTIAEVYRAAGYATVSYASNLFTGQFTNLHQGFEEVHEDGSLSVRGSSKTAREYVDRLTAWLDAHRDTPFFAFVHVYDPHDPYEPQRPYDSIWASPAHKEEHARHAREVKKFIKDPLAKAFGMPSREELLEAGIEPARYVTHEKNWYDGSIRGMDTEVGRLLERVRSLGLDERTLVVLAGDHGEEFHDHGRMFHGQTVYGELTNVPLIFRWPGVLRGGTSVDETTQTIDIMPTLLEMSGLVAPKGLQGQSLRPLLLPAGSPPARAALLPGSTVLAQSAARNVRWRPRPAFSEKALTKKDAGGPFPADTESYAVVSEGWKLVHNTVRPRGGPEFELYDAKKDPLDQHDLAARHPDVVQRLAERIAALRRVAEAARLKPDAEGTKGLSNEQLERLRSLGYIR